MASDTTPTKTTILVTGATGFIGAHIANILLARGIHIHITTRSATKAQAFVNARPQYADMILVFSVVDFTQLDPDTQLNPFLEAAKNTSGIIHVATPITSNVTDPEKELMLPAIRGTQQVLAAAASTPSVKRVVLTSSFSTVFDFTRASETGSTYTGKDWNPITYQQAISQSTREAYWGSKKFAELAAWSFIESEKPGFDLVTFCPPATIGPVVHPVDSVGTLNYSNAILWSLALGAEELQPVSVPLWIDVRDLALAHVEGLFRPEAGGQRYVVCSPERLNYDIAIKILQEHHLGADKRTYDEANLALHGFDADYQKAVADLGIEFHSFEECLVDTIKEFRTLPR